MQVLFLALGATRRRAVVEESGQVVADGGRAVVLVDQARTWSRDQFAPRVEVVELSRLESRHLPRLIERAIVFAGPRAVFRMAGRGPLAKWARRGQKAYERRIAARMDRAFMRLYLRLWGDVRQKLIDRHAASGAAVDLMVVCDPTSIPPAAQLMKTYEAGRIRPPQVSYSYDYLNRSIRPARVAGRSSSPEGKLDDVQA